MFMTTLLREVEYFINTMLSSTIPVTVCQVVNIKTLLKASFHLEALLSALGSTI